MTLALLEGLAVLALLHEVRGERAAAVCALRDSLGPTLAPILRRVFAERAHVHHAQNVLVALEAVLAAQPAATRAGGAPQPDHPENPLSDRELQVLRCLALRLTNNEIGEELFISPITIKHHVANIAGKLAVSGRRAAVARARELGLIG